MTRDHVPTKSFFPRPRPSDLITVPACLQCNQIAGKEEEFFLATFMFSEAGVSEAGKRIWKEKLHRMYERNLGLRRKIAQNLSCKELFTPAGIYIGRKFTINRDDNRFDLVISKIVKGLFFFEFNEMLPAHVEITALFLDSKEKFDAASQYAQELVLGKKRWPGIFEYRVGRVVDEPNNSMWLFLFYNYATFWVITYSEN